MISIIIPVYNQAIRLIKTLTSIASQTYQNFEVIIVNDGSHDGVEKVFAQYYQKLATEINYLFINQPNRGAPAARNRGFLEARGEYLFFCDADVVLEPNALEAMVGALEQNSQASYAYSAFKWGHKLFKVGEFDSERLKREPYINTMSLIRRVDFPANGWDETLKKFQDWDLWLTMLEAGKVVQYFSQVLFTVATGGTISSWLPSFAYKLLPFLPRVKKYQAAKKIIQIKYGFSDSKK